MGLIARGEVFFQRHGGKAIFIGRFITGLKAVVPGIAGMLGMNWGYFTFINTISAFVWAASHILPGMFLTQWLKSIGLSLELVIIFGTIILTVVFVLIHYWKRILLFFAPWMGEYGKFPAGALGQARGRIRTLIAKSLLDLAPRRRDTPAMRNLIMAISCVAGAAAAGRPASRRCRSLCRQRRHRRAVRRVAPR